MLDWEEVLGLIAVSFAGLATAIAVTKTLARLIQERRIRQLWSELLGLSSLSLASLLLVVRSYTEGQLSVSRFSIFIVSLCLLVGFAFNLLRRVRS